MSSGKPNSMRAKSGFDVTAVVSEADDPDNLQSMLGKLTSQSSKE